MRVGDKVRVTFEGTVTKTGDLEGEGGRIVVKADQGGALWVLPAGSVVTILEGQSVVRLGDRVRQQQPWRRDK